MRIFRSAVCLATALLSAPLSGYSAQLDILNVPGRTLEGNPLGDPARRQVALFSPDGADKAAPLPIILYLPGWGGSSQDLIASGGSAWPGRVVDELNRKGVALRIAVPDCRSRYGGSQYIDSTATGPYDTYLADEIIPFLEDRYGRPKSPRPAWIVAGHSSGGYGALMFANAHPALCRAVVALSPDSDFETTHRPLVEDPVIKAIRPEELAAAMAPRPQMHLPRNGLERLIMGLCANYTPSQGQPGRFDWLYDEKHNWRPLVWKRWLEHDPYVILKNRRDAFTPAQRIYLDGAEHDEFGANIGARKIFDLLKARGIPCSFIETPGNHSDRISERLETGLEWVFFGK